MKDYYERLGLDSSATPDAIKSAYRRLAVECHPDRVGHLDAEAQAGASRRMAEINEAYTVLSSPAQRRDYDRQLERAAWRAAGNYDHRSGAHRAATPSAAATGAEEAPSPGPTPAAAEIETAPPPPSATRPAAAEAPSADRPAAQGPAGGKGGRTSDISVVRQVATQLRTQLTALKDMSFQAASLDGFDWVLQGGSWTTRYVIAARVLANVDRGAVTKLAGFARQAAEKNKGFLRKNFFLVLLLVQRMSELDGVSEACHQISQSLTSQSSGGHGLVALVDVPNGRSLLCGSRSKDVRFEELLRSLRLAR